MKGVRFTKVPNHLHRPKKKGGEKPKWRPKKKKEYKREKEEVLKGDYID